MTQATNEVIATSLDRKVDLRTAAYINGINKLHEFYMMSGIPGCEWFAHTFIYKILINLLNFQSFDYDIFD